MNQRQVVAWIDASAGVAGDMLLAALLDLGADLHAVQAAVDAVIPGAVQLGVHEVSRAGMRALKADVGIADQEPVSRTWRSIRDLLESAALAAPVHADALRVFGRLAEAEARVHGIAAEDVHFHEVGALDSIADIVGVCAALHDLGVATLTAGTIAVGSGRIASQHGELAIPGPAVLELVRGWTVRAGGTGELATPTGVAVLVALATQTELAEQTVVATGVGAGSRDTPERANVVRIVLGDAAPVAEPVESAVLLACNVDDMDPRLWPGVLAELLAHGAADAWLAPIQMKKGRPAHTLHVLCAPELASELRTMIYVHTSTIGVRQQVVAKHVLARAVVPVQIRGAEVRIKVAHRGGQILNATAEYEDVAALARSSGVAESHLLAEAAAAAQLAGLVPGARWD